jgi:hypothetical protein
MRRLAFGGCVAGVVVLAAIASAHTTGALSERAACAPSWRVVARGDDVPDLSGVAAVSAHDVWLVGQLARGYPLAGVFRHAGVITHWDGRRLQTVHEFRTRSVRGISALAANDIWAVGSEFGNTDSPLVLHWDGRRWLPTPTPPLRSEARLNAVVALSRKNVWAVGQVGTRPLAMHWDGRSWRVLGIRHEGSLNAVDGTSAGNIWTVGAQGLYAPSVNDERGLVLRWDGHRWKEAAGVALDDTGSGYEASNDFTGVAVVSPTQAWATHNGVVSGDVQRWDGTRWIVARSLAPKSILEDVAAVSGTDAWAVGPTSGTPSEERPLIVHWDGRLWRIQKTPLSSLQAGLSSLSILSDKNIWAAGDHLIAQYTC